MQTEPEEIAALFKQLCDQPRQPFPKAGESLDAPRTQGVYIIRKDEDVLHVGRTVRAKGGLHQRFNNHLRGLSSFTRKYSGGKAGFLREAGHTYQFIEVEDSRKRALLEAYLVGVLCPAHLGVGEVVSGSKPE